MVVGFYASSIFFAQKNKICAKRKDGVYTYSLLVIKSFF